jgi:outer membrane protein assembly factor BamA
LPARGGDELPSSGQGAPRLSLRYELEGIEVRGNQRTRERVVLRYVPFQPGSILDVDDPEIELTRFRLLGTGFFRSVSLSLRRGTKRGAVVMMINVIERNTIVVNDVWLGLSTTADADGNARPLSAYAGADVAETNLAGTGITLGGAFALAENQLGLRLRFLDPAFLGGVWMTQGTLFYNSAREFYGNRSVFYDDPFGGAHSVEDFAVARYTRFGGTLGAGRDLSVATQVWFDYRLESIQADLPLAASQLRGNEREPLLYDLIRGRSVLSTFRASLIYDTRDAQLLPTRGWHLVVASDTSLSPFGSSYPFQKLQIRASRWWELPWHHVARLELFGGAIGGNAPVFEKFYIADFSDLLPDRVLDLNIDRRPAPNFFHTAIAELRQGDYAARVQGEYRIPLYRGSRSVYGIDFFSAAGLYSVATRREFTDPATGYSGLARAPIDFTFNLGLRVDSKAGGFVIAFANALGFAPALRGSR